MNMNRGILNLQLDFFLPLWRRVLLVAVCTAWALVEFVFGADLWGVIVGSVAVAAAWQFFFDGWPRPDSQPDSQTDLMTPSDKDLH